MSELDGYIHDGSYNESDGALYLLTTTGVYKLDGAGNKTLLFENEFFNAFWNSIAVPDGKVYCSFAPGVLCYDMTTGEQTFYEMDYAAYAD